MQMAYRLNQEQHVKLFITPELKQSLHILQLAGMDLAPYLQEQAVENPFIEIEWLSESFYSGSGVKNMEKSNFNPLDTYGTKAATRDTLENWVMHQFRMTDYSLEQFKAFSYLAGNLNEAGYLAVSMKEAAQKLNLPSDVMETALRTLQSLDPPGVGGRTLQECLTIQIERDPQAIKGALEVVSGYLQDLSKGRTDKISKELNIEPLQVSRILTYIRTLNPRPGLAFVADEEQNIIVDAHVYMNSNQFVIELNHRDHVKVSVNKEYLHMVGGLNDIAVSRFYEEKIKEAHWLLRSLNQRNQTLLKVITAIVEEQAGFMNGTASGIRPMTLRNIAQKLDLHESTVSRAVKNKYIRTPRGIFELKFFFSIGIQTNGGEDISAQNIKCMIKEMIHRENKRKPLSDQDITNRLNEKGICLSRRTVAKYREEEHILCSSLRRQTDETLNYG
ncbi:RNA polymerase factor sigma-54 [Paenibacillus azoreducens]|uniref:RNA polymerase sigma-54 factor n=1 Tax=Paenibacillus azoreducens TaxID=116718 RepID=A0A920CS38_9BACL|nr:RNA polymerase factor sigma-54 [Paenibacillus azoreducens]GIO47038.1 RNA polymerase sigma-54 factor [Paenibacillus azoreducens]